MKDAPLYAALGSTYPLLLGLPFLLAGLAGGIPALESGAFAAAFTGEWSFVAMVLTSLCFIEMAYYHLSLFPQGIGNPKMRLILVVFPEVFAIFGFLLAFLTGYPWAGVPFAALGFANYAYALLRLMAVPDA